jgi:hypothetical protein
MKWSWWFSSKNICNYYCLSLVYVIFLKKTIQNSKYTYRCFCLKKYGKNMTQNEPSSEESNNQTLNQIPLDSVCMYTEPAIMN